MTDRIAPEDRTDVQTTMCALLLYAVRDDCDASMDLLKLADRTIVNHSAHHLAHIIGNLVIAQEGRNHAEASVRELLDLIASGAR